MSAPPLIQVDELKRLLAGPVTDRPVVLDVRFRLGKSTGRQEYERAHIPGASYVDMDAGLATIRPDGVGGRHPMPAVQTFTAAMRSAGVTMSRQVVAYDDWVSLPASRVWWMLRHLGFLDIRVLDGGMGAWTVAGLATESGPHTPVVGDFLPSGPGLGRVLDATAATSYAEQGLLIDARSADRFRGENESIDAVAGHIPGAINAPALDNVAPDGRFLTADQLADSLRELGIVEAADASRGAVASGADGIVRARRVGTYCGSGVQATHLALALSAAGITDEADVYIGSWSDWITDPNNPIAVG
ncbi:MAG: sulfurtransferase [Actinomycetota bacterium]